MEDMQEQEARKETTQPKRTLSRQQEAERSIIKKYRKPIWKKFITAAHQYELVKEGDRIAVCISGGKDSFVMAKCFQELQKHGNVNFELVFLLMDPGYNDYNRQIVDQNAELLGVPLTAFESDIFDVVAEVDTGSPCYLCARMRRGYLYKNAKARGCNKIALGHHFDDVIETILMSMLYGAEIRTMMPKLHSTNYPGMELIRPMSLVREDDIWSWVRHNELQFIQCACRLTENCVMGDQGGGSKREEMKRLVKQFRKTSSYIDMNIYRSVENVHIDAVTGFRRGDGSRHSFLEDYDEYPSRYGDED